MALIDCLIRMENGTTIMVYGDNDGTGCIEGSENDEYITPIMATPIEAMLIEPPQEYVKNQANFCKRCGQAHKTSWCK
jgi:hypothetical protein